jgi:hypothetical protein
MKLTWLTALAPISLAFTSLLVSAAPEQGCLGEPALASEGDVRFLGDLVDGATVPGCDSSDSSKQDSQVAFERTGIYGAVPSFPFAPEPSGSILVDLASLDCQLGKEAGDANPSIRGRPP